MAAKLKKRQDILYVTPQVETLFYSLEGLVCDSPDPGENENVEYDDWN